MFKLVSDSGENTGRGQMTMDVEDSGLAGQQSSFVTESISSLAKLSAQTLLRSLFQKLMHRLLGEIQEENPKTERICSLLSLAESLVAAKQMDESNLAFLYRALKPLIRTDEHGPRVQKKAYKVLAEVCRNHHSFVVDRERLREIVSLLTGTIMTSQIAARYMRLKCLNLVIDGLAENEAEYMVRFKGRFYRFSEDYGAEHLYLQKEFSGMTGELLLCLKDTNAKTREAAFQVILSLYSKSKPLEFLSSVTAGLGAETPHMRSASVTAISRITFVHAKESDNFQNVLPSMLKTVLVLAEEDSREVIKSVLVFIRVCVAAIPYHQLSPLLPDLVKALLTYHKSKDRFRSKIKIILKKLVKIFGYDALTPYVPGSESRLLTHMRKLEQRQKRKKERGAHTNEKDNFDDMLESDEEDSDDGVTFTTGMTGFSRLTGKTRNVKSITSVKSRGATMSRAETSKSRRKGTRETSFRLPDGGDGDVVDMLGSKMSKNVHFADNRESDESDTEFEMDNTGKLIIRDEEKDEEAQDDIDDTSARLRENKRRRLDKKGGLGSSYKSKKAGGDVKRKGQKYEPYAFMPLDGRSYTKKNRGAMVEQMSTVVRGRDKRKRR
jgi:ribosomal RNA-processing protein 12